MRRARAEKLSALFCWVAAERTDAVTTNEKRCRGIRGAITVEANTPKAILVASRELLTAIIETNSIEPDDVGGVFFTATVDLNAEYPAFAAREMGWQEVAILCGHEMNVPGGIPMCIRVMVLWNTTCAAKDIRHIYLREAQRLRPDRAYQPSA
ncbi:MAG: chorismate mutase [Anaerolineae bacterium]|nr:chorismate mutase [Anaerolineae bacterium]